MIDHDKNVGTLLALLDELKIADNTFVMYSTDNGPHMNSWPDAGMIPFRSEKNSNWEGAYRVPAMVRIEISKPRNSNFANDTRGKNAGRAGGSSIKKITCGFRNVPLPTSKN
jgi:arylsulfatase A-like enzyme